MVPVTWGGRALAAWEVDFQGAGRRCLSRYPARRFILVNLRGTCLPPVMPGKVYAESDTVSRSTGCGSDGNVYLATQNE